MLEALKRNAPPLPSYKADYRVIYWEPIAHSGERITIAIAAQSTSDTKVIQTISNATLKQLFGSRAKNAVGLITLTINSIKKYLETGLPLSEWTSPLDGFKAAPTQTSYSNKELEGIFYQAITSFSSLYQGDIVNKALNENNDGINIVPAQVTRRIVSQVRKLVPDYLKNNFNKSVTLHNNSTTIIVDYLGVNLNADFINLNIKDQKRALVTAKSKLLDLETLRDYRQKNPGNNNQSFTLLASAQQQTAAQDTYQQLQEFAKINDINMQAVKDSLKTAEYIINAEKAA